VRQIGLRQNRVVSPHGRLWWASAAEPHHRPMPEWRLRLAGDRMLPMWASMPLDAIRRSRETPIWKLEPSFRCRSCGTRRYKPPVRMIKLTEQQEITPCLGASR
jgi:hypothetical protein